mgnify:CR=1 FL=1
MDNQDKYSEATYRVSFDIAKLLKQAGFKELVHAYYNEYAILKKGPDLRINGTAQNFNLSSVEFFSAPLISIALEWVKELGYELDMIDQYLTLRLNGLDISTSDDYYFSPIEDKRECDLFFLKTAITHHFNKA